MMKNPLGIKRILLQLNPELIQCISRKMPRTFLLILRGPPITKGKECKQIKNFFESRG